MTLVEFLTARIEEDEAAQMPVLAGARGWGKATARRALAECAAKRRIIVEHRSGEAWCDYCNGGGSDDEHMDSCVTLRLLASVYADHPAFDPSWGPQ